MNGHNFRQNRSFFLIILFSLLLTTSCNTRNNNQPSGNLRSKIDTVKAPVLSPAEALKHFVIEDNFKIQLVASEPLISAPVALNFDDKGRISKTTATVYWK